MWTYEPRQGRNAATVVCSAFAVVTLVFLFNCIFEQPLIFAHALSSLSLGCYHSFGSAYVRSEISP